MSNHKKEYLIETFESGPMDNMIYLIVDVETKNCAIVDPAWDLNDIYKYIEKYNLKLTKILLTHSHNDHVNALDEILRNYDLPIHINIHEKKFWGKKYNNYEINYGGDIISLGKSELKSIHSPGHTPGSTCYLIDNKLIAGDTLFVFGCGRCDLHGGNPEDMFKTLNHMKFDLGEDTLILPGHNYSIRKTSTMKDEILYNPFFHFKKLEDFVKYRMITHDKTRSSPYGPMPKS